MKVQHLRLGREMKLGNVLTFMANERVASEDAVAGDIIGIHNHGQLQIGDTLTEGEALGFKGIPYFAPGALPRRAAARSVQGRSSCRRACSELGEEGAIQVFEPVHRQHAAAGRGRPAAVRGRRRIAWRASTRSTRSTTRRASRPRAGSPIPTRRRAATSSASSAASLATDVDGNPVFLATNKYNLQVTMERWPKVGFHATREHGQRLEHA